MPLAQTYTLNTGSTIPAVGCGCWMGVPTQPGHPANEETEKMVKTALGVGYRHFDTASGYGNEEAVGRVLKDSGLPRESYFVTTKLHGPDHARVAAAFDESLERLGLEYIDLFLMHWPQPSDPADPSVTLGPNDSPTFSETWAAMEALFESHKGKIKHIGVSNFSIQNLEILLQTAKIVPAVNQVEAHPYLPNDALLAYCTSKGIHCTAYSPVGQWNSPILHEPVVLLLAEKYSKTPGQVVLSWGVQRGWSVVPKSSNEGRLRQNLDVFELEKEDLDAISAIHKEEGKYRSLCDYGLQPSDPSDVLFGWRIKEDLGWDYPITVPKDGGWRKKM
ncbi:hypothetical protein JCM10213_003045 [Rhodosporidiobolus nylandii]